jgi:hypothetical protein
LQEILREGQSWPGLFGFHSGLIEFLNNPTVAIQNPRRIADKRVRTLPLNFIASLGRNVFCHFHSLEKALKAILIICGWHGELIDRCLASLVFCGGREIV